MFCFDPRYYNLPDSKTAYGTRKTGLLRARFQIESVQNLKNNLRLLGSDLIVTNEKAEDFIPKLLVAGKANVVAYQQEITKEERDIEWSLEQNIEKLKGQNGELVASTERFWGHTLYHIDDLDFDPAHNFQNNQTTFR